MAELFEGRHFDREVIILCVRWYLRFKLSLRDLVEMMAERGLSMAHTTIMRWVQHYTPEFEKRWKRFARAVGRAGLRFVCRRRGRPPASEAMNRGVQLASWAPRQTSVATLPRPSW